MDDERKPDDRTFSERVEKVNLAFLVRVPVEMAKRLAQLVEDDLNETDARLIYTKMSSSKLFIEEVRDG